jgi:hypothetical protein
VAAFAYEPVLQAQDRPIFEQDSFYAEAAQNEARIINCHVWNETPRKSYAEIIGQSLDRLVLYPDKPEIKDVMVRGILQAFEFQVRDEFTDNTQEVFTNGDLIKTKIGDYQIFNNSVSEYVDRLLGEKGFCSGTPTTSIKVGTSNIKKIFNCKPDLSPALKVTGLLAADNSEIWYVLQYKSASAGPVNCTGHNNDSGKNFSYTYSDQSNISFVLKDARTGRVLGNKTFQGKAPKCVFTSCRLNLSTNMAVCTGGEGSSTFDIAVLIQWLKGYMK